MRDVAEARPMQSSRRGRELAGAYDRKGGRRGQRLISCSTVRHRCQPFRARLIAHGAAGATHATTGAGRHLGFPRNGAGRGQSQRRLQQGRSEQEHKDNSLHDPA